jgi:hypothetical protein
MTRAVKCYAAGARILVLSPFPASLAEISRQLGTSNFSGSTRSAPIHLYRHLVAIILIGPLVLSSAILLTASGIAPAEIYE